MNDSQIKQLIKRLRASTILTDPEKHSWEEHIETMNDGDLGELFHLLDEAEKIDVDTELPKYAQAVKQAATVCNDAINSMEQYISSSV